MKIISKGSLGKFKKADLSFNVIIVAIIALIVLVVVISIFSSKTGGINTSLNSCLTSGGVCVPSENCDGTILNSVECNDPELICCRGLIKEKSTTTE